MADIELVIKIPEDVFKRTMFYREFRDLNDCVTTIKALEKAIPLPRGHGRIADMDEAIKCIKDVNGDDAIWAIGLIEWACSKRTIIEADTKSEEQA